VERGEGQRGGEGKKEDNGGPNIEPEWVPSSAKNENSEGSPEARPEDSGNVSGLLTKEENREDRRSDKNVEPRQVVDQKGSLSESAVTQSRPKKSAGILRKGGTGEKKYRKDRESRQLSRQVRG